MKHLPRLGDWPNVASDSTWTVLPPCWTGRLQAHRALYKVYEPIERVWCLRPLSVPTTGCCLARNFQRASNGVPQRASFPLVDPSRLLPPFANIAGLRGSSPCSFSVPYGSHG
jgi:hypothetical protein